MTDLFIVIVVFAGLVLALSVVCGTILLAMKWKHGGISRKHRQSQADETRMIQEIYHGLSRMEQRVEALETILMDHQGKDRQT